MRNLSEIAEVRQLSNLAADILQDVQKLLRQEGRLIRLEFAEEVQHAKRYATLAAWRWASIAVAQILGTLALVHFLVEVAGMQNWTAYLSVAIASGLVGLTLYLIGKKRIPFEKGKAFVNVKESVQCLTKQNC